MRTRSLAVLLALPLALGTIAAEGDEPELYGACASPAGTVVTPAEPFSGEVETPVGALNFTFADAGTYTISYEGLEIGTVANRVDLTLDFDTPGGLGDYDLVINGVNDLSVEQPERHTESAPHCAVFQLETEVFTGTPFDTLTLDVVAR